MRRAPRSTSWSARRAITACRTCSREAARGAKVVDHRISGRGQVRPPAPPAPAAIRGRGVTAFVTVQEGCDKFCTFCVVPYTRGAESRARSRASSPRRAARRRGRARGHAARAERQRLPRRGPGRAGVARPPAACASPRSPASRGCATPRAIRATWTTTSSTRIAISPPLMPYLHLPVQSGSDRILAAMNRSHTARRLPRDDRADPRRAARHRASVGFHRRLSGRDRSGFRDTLRLVDAVGFASAFSFKYSPRPGTPAAERDDQVDEDVKTERLARLQALIDRHQDAFNRACVGRDLRRAVRKAGPAARARSSAARPICSRCRSWRRHP